MKKPKTYPLLNACHRRQSALAVAEMNTQPPRTTEQCLAQYERMQKQKAEYLQKNVVQTDSATGLIQWSMWSEALDSGFSLGHGVHYHDSFRAAQENDVVAFIRRWRRRDPGEIIQGYYIRPDAITSAEVIAELKQKIEVLVAGQVQHFRPETWLTDRIYAAGNC
jgi:hypothetical protein